jgi:chemotaxis protein methyltransferase CheR
MRLIGAVGERLTRGQFGRIRQLVESMSGIHLAPDKRELVRARLRRRLRALRLTDFDDYLRLVAADRSGRELETMLDLVATHLTGFFRESDHFECLRRELTARSHTNAHPRRVRIWSAGCATGEEAYSLAITLREALPDAAAWDARILATDLAARGLAVARRGVYTAERVAEVPPVLRARYFEPTGDGGDGDALAVRHEARALLTFARLNLVEPWPMRGPFDAIFCRNVMIYFDRHTQRGLVQRFGEILAPNGLLFLGHCESLTGSHPGLRFVQPSVYRRA